VILDGIGHAIGSTGRFTIGVAGIGADLTLPDAFSGAEDCLIPLVREGGRLWFIDNAAPRGSGQPASGAPRTAIDAGDRLMIRSGSISADVLFAHCGAANGSRAHD
jgi:hypothetical protein